MNKSDLVRSIAEKTDSTLRDSEAMLKAFTETVVDAVAKGQKVSLVGFGSFDVVKRKARTGRNPATGAKIQIKARKVPKFTAGKEFRNTVE
ncbi:HU family DNA-binding protein [bacterium]|nr:HU family DNA-binding protein [bacterium]